MTTGQDMPPGIPPQPPRGAFPPAGAFPPGVAYGQTPYRPPVKKGRAGSSIGCFLIALAAVAVIAGVVVFAIHRNDDSSTAGGTKSGPTVPGGGAPGKPVILQYDPVGFTNTCEYADEATVSEIVGQPMTVIYNEQYPACQYLLAGAPSQGMTTGIEDLRGGGLFDTINRVKSNLDPNVVDVKACSGADVLARKCFTATTVDAVGDGALLVRGFSSDKRPTLALWVRRNGVALKVQNFLEDKAATEPQLVKIAQEMLRHVPAPPKPAIAPAFDPCQLLPPAVRTITLGQPGDPTEGGGSKGSPGFSGNCSYHAAGSSYPSIRLEQWATAGTQASLEAEAREATNGNTNSVEQLTRSGRLAALDGVGDGGFLVKQLNGSAPRPFVLACGRVFSVSVQTSYQVDDQAKAIAAAKVIASLPC